MNRNSNFLLILAICFIIVFALTIIFVNNWLKKTLQEEEALQRGAPVVTVSKPTYKQIPIGSVSQKEPSIEAQKKVAPEAASAAGTSKTKMEQKPIAREKILAN